MHEEEFAELGCLSNQVDGATVFGQRAAMRHQCRKNFVHLDCSSKVKNAILHKAKPIPGPYGIGDMVMFRREQGATMKGEESP